MNLPGLDSKQFAGKVTLVNVFASWCAPCREEHPVLLALSQDKRFVMAALNYKDQPENARRFLGDLGNPFQAIGVDEAGRTAIDWGVYGVPETFVIGKDGKIAYKHVGPLTAESARVCCCRRSKRRWQRRVRRRRLAPSSGTAAARRPFRGEKRLGTGAGYLLSPRGEVGSPHCSCNSVRQSG